MTSIKEFNGVPEGYAKDQYSDYKFFEITTTAIPTETLTGSFVVVNQETGLGRQVNIIVSPPFEITRNRIFAGNYNVPDQFPYNRLQWENKVEAEIGKPLTVFFTLDDNLPEAIFPLVFEIESNQQDIENNPIGTLVVSSGPSVFTEGKRRIKYQKVVTWQNYNDELSADNPFGLIVPDKLNDHNGNKKIRRVRCRLRTINSVDTETETTLRITNPYFKQGKWTKIDWNGNNLDIIKASDIIEVKYTRDPSNNPIGVPDYTDWNSSLIP